MFLKPRFLRGFFLLVLAPRVHLVLQRGKKHLEKGLHMRWYDAYDEETKMIVDSVRSFCKRDATPVYKTHEAFGRFPDLLIPKMAELGLFGLTIPEEYGGLGQSTLVSSLVARELAYCWGALHLIWTANCSLAAFPIMFAGTEEQKRRFLPQLASGEILGCYALTEPNAGSDVAGMSVRARKKKDSWILHGSKIFITNAWHAQVAIVFAKTGDGEHDISAFIVESKEEGLILPGITVRKIPKRVQKSSDFCEITFDDVVLSEHALLGERNQGFKIAMTTLDRGRINIAAQAVGIAASVWDGAFEYVTKTRSQFGRRVWRNQAIQFQFAMAWSRLQAAWAMIEKTSLLADAGVPITQFASATKLFASETADDVAHNIVKKFGGMAVTEELEWFARANDVFPTTIYEGTSDIQHIVIARELEKNNT